MCSIMIGRLISVAPGILELGVELVGIVDVVKVIATALDILEIVELVNATWRKSPISMYLLTL